MIVDIDVGGRRHQVRVVPTSSGHDVWFGGRMLTGSLAGASPLWSLLVGAGGSPTEAMRSYEVQFDSDSVTGDLAVTIDGRMVSASIVDSRLRARTEASSAGGSTQRLLAPMPGRIVRLLVAAGERVEARQPLVVIEAMKMENELHAAIAGTVTDVHVETGSAVEARALLLVINADQNRQ